MLQEFGTHVNNSLSFLRTNKLLIAISGGLDSVVLTHLCHALKLDIALAHCNFNLRNDESDGDEQFVLDLADSLNLEIFIESFETEDHAQANKLSTQMAARTLRYDWFEELTSQLGFDFILTAHHADDNLETFLINLSRGTGMDGLIGIPEQNGNIVRPLLPFSRDEVETYAKLNNLKWREDASNASDAYLRNALRHHVVPNLKELNPQILQNFKKTSSHLRDLKDIVQDRIDDVSMRIILIKDHGEVHLDIEELKTLSNPRIYLYQLLKDYGFTEWNDVENLLYAQSGKQIISLSHRLIKDRNVLILNKLKDLNNNEQIFDEVVGKIRTANGTVLFFDEADALFSKRTDIKDAHNKYNKTIFVDKDLLNFPLSVRGWREGDYFYPFGMKGKKKLSKYFKDEKLSLPEKERIQILCSGEDIIWVIGRRADDRYKVTDKTEHILKITIEA